MVQLSVNVNKVALLRNARGGNLPSVDYFAEQALDFGAHGITVHPRPDGRHIRSDDVFSLRRLTARKGVEFNMEGYPSEDFLQMVEAACPEQCTLVPDAPSALTSDAGWAVAERRDLLGPVLDRLQGAGIRVSLFVDCAPAPVQEAAQLGAARVELYTGPYAHLFPESPDLAIQPVAAAAAAAQKAGIGLNAGHDLDTNNLPRLVQACPQLLEVSIGHALVNDCLYLGLEATMRAYLKALLTFRR